MGPLGTCSRTGNHGQSRCRLTDQAVPNQTLNKRRSSQQDSAIQQFLLEMFNTAVQSVSAEATVPQHLPPAASGKTIVIGAGKAAASMAQAVEAHWSGSVGGRVVTRYGHGAPCKSITVVEASHPVPDAAGQEAAEQILQIVSELHQDDLVICLISGGGSSLLALPASGITLKDKQSINKALLRSGATIAEMNCVRKHLSAIKGGQLAAACSPAQVVTLIISDVPGDDPAVVASGPTVPDPTTLANAQDILSRYAIDVAGNVQRHLANAENETPKPGDAVFQRMSTKIIATAQQSLAAAAQFAEQAGYTPLVLGDLEGESRDVASVHAGIARQVARYGQPAAAPCVILSGGETTVTVRGNGRGGRNAEFSLSLAIALQAESNVYAIACDTDGIDGTEDNAGCIVTPDILARARDAGMNPTDYLENNDGYGFFSALDALVVTGPTRTNVNDFRAIVITEAAGNSRPRS